MSAIRSGSTDLLAAVVLTLAWAGLLSLQLHDFVAGYFPLSDEWALLAHSDSRFADPLHWFTQGFAGYFEEPPGLSTPYTNFLRPVVNFCYWLQSLWLEPESGRRLYFNYVVIGAGAGTCLLAMRGMSLSRPVALLLAAAVPLMPAFLPSNQLLFFPMMAYDPLVACLCLLAAILYRRALFTASGIVLLIAVFTKETSVPVAAALPLLYLMEHRRSLLDKERDAWSGFAALSAPLGIWLVCRYSLYGSLSQGTYTHTDGIGDALRYAPRAIMRVPFWSDRTPASLDAAALNLFANAVVMLGGLAIIARRAMRQGRPHVLEMGLLFSYLFMLRYGKTERFGATMDLFLVACIALWLGEPESRRYAAVVVTGLAIGLLIADRHALRDFQARRDALAYYHDVGRRYVEALRAVPSGERVVVLNDPASWFSRMDWLLRVERIPVDAVKVAEATCYVPRTAWLRQCAVSLRADPPPGHYFFDASCGVDVCGAAPGRGQPVSYSPAPGVQVELHPGDRQLVDASAGPRWRSLSVVLDDPRTRLLYFDPAIDDFRTSP